MCLLVAKRRAAVTGLRGVLFFALLATACRPFQAEPAPRGRSVVTIGVPEGNVVATSSGAGEFKNTFVVDGLTQLSNDGRVLPRLAEKWQWEANGRRLRLFLRHPVKIHDGTTLTAARAAEALSRVIPNNRASYPSLKNVTGVRAESDTELVIDLSAPSPLLPEDLPFGLRFSNDPKEMVGTGPYRLVKDDKNGEVVLERFDEYYLGRPNIERIVIKPIDTLRNAWSSLLRGTFDSVTDVPADAVEFIRGNDVQVFSHLRRYQYLVAFDSEFGPFKSPVVRRALNMVVDRDLLISRVLQGHGLPSTGPMWSQHWAYDSSVQGYAHDPIAAASMLDAAGYPTKASAPGSSQQSRFRFTCLIPSNFAILERLGLELQRQFYSISVDMQFEAVPLTEYVNRTNSGRFQAVLLDMNSGPTLTRSSIYWRSARDFKGLNNFHYENADADRLFDLLQSATNEAAIRSTTSRLERVFLDDPPAVFLAWNERTRAIRREFTIPTDPGRDPLLTLWRWTTSAPLQTASTQ